MPANYSTDSGTTWQATDQRVSDSGTVADGPALVATGSGAVWASWRVLSGTQSIIYADHGGSSWGTDSIVVADTHPLQRPACRPGIIEFTRVGRRLRLIFCCHTMILLGTRRSRLMMRAKRVRSSPVWRWAVAAICMLPGSTIAQMPPMPVFMRRARPMAAKPGAPTHV